MQGKCPKPEMYFFRSVDRSVSVDTVGVAGLDPLKICRRGQIVFTPP